MYTIIYKSVMSPDLTQNDIRSMLYYARTHNEKNNISGCIFYGNSRFLQMIEGSERVITKLYSKIEEDNRHHSVELLLSENSSQKLFRDWNMVFFNLRLFEDFKNGEDNFIKNILEDQSDKISEHQSLAIIKEQIKYLKETSS